MLDVSEKYKEIIFNRRFLEWEYRIEIGKKSYDSKIIKSFDISGQLQNKLTIGSSLALTLNLELLLSEKTKIAENSVIRAYLKLLNDNINEEVLVGTFITKEIDRKSLGKIKIVAEDYMSHADYFQSLASNYDIGIGEEDLPLEMRDLVVKICRNFNIKIEKNIQYGNLINDISYLEGLTYRQILEYVAGVYGGFVKITRDGKLTFFKFTETGIFLTKDNYYSMTRGYYKLTPAKINCAVSDNKVLSIGLGKEYETVYMENPYMTEDNLTNIFENVRRYQYYAITMSAIGTGILEPGDVITIEDYYGDKYKVFIQDYKLICDYGIKEEFESYYDYSNSKLTNSVNTKIEKLTNKLYDTDNIINSNKDNITNGVTKTEFETRINNLDKKIEKLNQYENKWTVEIYSSDGTVEDFKSVLNNYPIITYMIRDNSSLLADSVPANSIVRFFTSIYIKESKEISIKLSDTSTTYINNVLVNTNKYNFHEGWNTIDIYCRRGETEGNVQTSFKVRIPQAINDEYTNITSEDINKYSNGNNDFSYINTMNPYTVDSDLIRILKNNNIDSIIENLDEKYITKTIYNNHIKELDTTLKNYNKKSSLDTIYVNSTKGNILEDGSLENPFKSLNSAIITIPDTLTSDVLNIIVESETEGCVLSNKKCGLINIVLKDGVSIKTNPLLIKNIDGKVKIESENNSVIYYSILLHNIKNLELKGLKFYKNSTEFSDISLYSNNFNFKNLYDDSEENNTELKTIINNFGVFIGNCNNAVIKNCTFGEESNKLFSACYIDNSKCLLYNNSGFLTNSYIIGRYNSNIILPIINNLSQDNYNLINKPNIESGKEFNNASVVEGFIGTELESESTRFLN